MLSQCIWGGENVISYASRSLTKPERKYCATRKEMLALVWAVGQFRPYLLGRPFTVRTDHSAVQWLYSFKPEPEGQVSTLLESLAEYEFTVQHRPGKRLYIMLMLCLAYPARMPQSMPTAYLWTARIAGCHS